MADTVITAADLYDKHVMFCCLTRPLQQKTTSTKKNPQCASLSNPGKNKCEFPIFPMDMEHIVKINKAHKIVSL